MNYNVEKLSDYMYDRELFEKLSNQLYYVTDHLTIDYPHHYEWYYKKHLPFIGKEEREVLFIRKNDNICGVAFLKNTLDEKKICTFYVAEYARNIGIGRQLMKTSIEYLQTKKPLITMPASKVRYFLHFMFKYDWKITQIKDGYYTREHDEIVFNGTLD